MNLPLSPPKTAPAQPSLAPLPAMEILRLMDTSMGATVAIVDLDLRFRYVNAGFAMAFNVTASDMVGMSIHDVYNATDFESFKPYLTRALAGERVNYERLGRIHRHENDRLTTASRPGSERLGRGQPREKVWRTVSLSPWLDEQGRVVGAVHASLAVHELKASTEALQAANDRLSNHMDNSPLSVIELDANLRVHRASNRVTHMLGLNAEAIVGQALFKALGSGAHLHDLQQAFCRLQSGLETRNRIESVHLLADGRTVTCEWFNSALVAADGQVSSVMSLVEDVSARVEAQNQLRRLALHDALTGLPNRNAFSERLAGSLSRANRSHNPLVLLFIDLDGFKRVNDDFGHASGDEVLCEVARRLLLAVRETDVVARMGGDEFVVLLDTEVAHHTPERVCERIFSLLAAPCEFSNGRADIGASIGVARHSPTTGRAEDLLKRADAAMFEAKRAGKACVRYDRLSTA